MRRFELEDGSGYLLKEDGAYLLLEIDWVNVDDTAGNGWSAIADPADPGWVAAQTDASYTWTEINED